MSILEGKMLRDGDFCFDGVSNIPFGALRGVDVKCKCSLSGSGSGPDCIVRFRFF